MPFPKMKVCHVSGFGTVSRLVSSTKDDGTVETKVVSSNAKLPDARKFDISAQIKAGVTLQEVNTKVLGSGVSTEELAGAVSQVARKSISKNQFQQDDMSKE